ncbi:hypothetical protein MLD38_029102 [Melastoma candidum]|uniref:Uncharacterized protein n=1 Tax=Melastoma candidum TaxID=119954 RepID=A0ACB9N4U2_9MYRT|nr:hypothetical protein MLD38_029102 [Melastoma candidum]
MELLLLNRKTSFGSLTGSPRSPYSFSLSQNRGGRTFLFLAFISLQIVLFFSARSLPFSLSSNHGNRRFSSPVASKDALASSFAAADLPLSSNGDNCDSGRIYVYELPRFFNTEILDQCDNLNPWSSSCESLVNKGFGPPAEHVAGIVPEGLVPAWFRTDQFVTEIIFHKRIMEHKCRTMEPGSAAAFYIPFYAGLAVGKYLWHNHSTEDRDWHCRMMLDWLKEQEYYRKSSGWNHFVTMGRITWDFRRSKSEDWGSSCIYMGGMRNITRLLIERNPWDYFDVGVPYPTGFHPRSYSDVVAWQDFVRTRQRDTLFCFAGGTRSEVKNDFRGLLLDQCRNASGLCQAVNCAAGRCSNDTSSVLRTFLGSKFCLQPRGDSFTRRSLFDCMVAGSIPVLFWRRSAYYQYEWFLPSEPESYSIFIDRNEVKAGNKSIKEVLEGYSDEDVRRMRDKVVEYIPRLVYALSEQGLESMKDAFDVAIEGVLRRFREQEDWEYKWR